VSDHTSLDITDAITIEAWIDPSSVTGGTKSYTTTYNFVGVTSPSSGHIARYFEVDVEDPQDPPPNYGTPVEGTELNTLTTDGTSGGTPDTASQILDYAGNAEASAGQYDSISVGGLDDQRWGTVDPGANDNACLWFQLDIVEDPTDITQIDCKFEGYQDNNKDKGWFAIWNWHYSLWHVLEASMQTSDYDYTGTITVNPDHFVSSNGHILLIFFNEDVKQEVFCDYVEVKVTYTAAAGISKTDYGLGANNTIVYGTINGHTISASLSSGWNHVALTYANAKGTMRLYVNGSEDASQALSGAIRANAADLVIGDATSFAGLIDEVRILDYVRTGFNSGLVINEVCYWPSSGDEWVEMYNGGGSDINAVGYRFLDGDGNIYEVPAGPNYTVSPGEYVTIWFTDTPSTDDAGNWYTINGNPHSLGAGDLEGDGNSGGDRIYMYPNATTGYANLIDFIGWGSGDGNDTEAEAAGIWDMDAANPYVADDGEDYEVNGVQMYAGAALGLVDDGNDEEAKPDWTAYESGSHGGSNVTEEEFAVELMSFEAMPDDWAVKLSWRTEAEIDNDRWLITRSVGAVCVENPVEGGEPPTQGYEQIADLTAQGSLSDYTYLDTTVSLNTTYYYKLGDVETNGDTTWHGPVKATPRGKEWKLGLAEPYPNPFTEAVTIDYSVSGRSRNIKKPVRLSVYDMSGRLCEIIVDEKKPPGVYRASWTPANLSSGIYFFRMDADGAETKRVLLLK
jgi:hypothetical protein